nr:hypothetical protein [Tanacetum cinerariifolium]
DANDDGDDLSEDDATDKDEEESSDSEKEEEEHLALIFPAPAQYSSVSESDKTKPFEEGKTAATPPPFRYRIAARISVQPHILMPFRTESEVERLLAIPTPPLSPVSLTSYTLPPLQRHFLYTLHYLFRHFHYLRRYHLLLEVAHSRDYCARIMDYCQSREVYTSTLVTQMEALRRDISTLQRQNIKHTQRDEVAHSRDYYARIMDYCQSREVHTSTLVTHMEALRREKMAPKRSTRLNPGTTPVTTPSTTTTSVTNAQLQAMINEGVNAALAARDATRNGDDSHTSGTGARWPVQVARECSYFEFLKCKPLDYKGTEGVIELTRWFEKMEWCLALAIAQHLIRSNLRLALCKTMLLHGGIPMLRPLLLRKLMP